MPNHQSAIKRHRQSLKRRDRNRTARSAIRTAISKVSSAVKAGDMKLASTLLKDAEKMIARAGSKHLIHPRNASRKISRLTKMAGSSKSK
ncbi:MAG: 30S ribosomal protein S20 [Oligoflexia bacterium]|nr:30S ribosomal protein S20 [Oligoflexia bacterium]